ANAAHVPRTYTIEPDKTLSGVWNIAGPGAADYDLSVYGPNGFFRAFKGTISPSAGFLDVQTAYDAKTDRLTLTISNLDAHPADVGVYDNYTRKTSRQVIDAVASVSKRFSLDRFGGWYDFAITVAHDAAFAYQLAGHLETGNDSISDPAMGGLL